VYPDVLLTRIDEGCHHVEGGDDEIANYCYDLTDFADNGEKRVRLSL
jgi:hypothetical protein